MFSRCYIHDAAHVIHWHRQRRRHDNTTAEHANAHSCMWVWTVSVYGSDRYIMVSLTTGDGPVSRAQKTSERRRATCNRRAAPWPHHADSTTAPLAARASTSDLQDRRPGLPVSDWTGRHFTSALLPKSARADSDRPTQRCTSSDVQITVSAIGVLRLLNHARGSTLDMSCIVFFLEKQFLPMHSGADDTTEN